MMKALYFCYASSVVLLSSIQLLCRLISSDSLLCARQSDPVPGAGRFPNGGDCAPDPAGAPGHHQPALPLNDEVCHYLSFSSKILHIFWIQVGSSQHTRRYEVLAWLIPLPYSCRVLQKHFSEAERQEGAAPVLSLFALTSKMNRGQAAKIFYQVCGEASDTSYLPPYDEHIMQANA